MVRGGKWTVTMHMPTQMWECWEETPSLRSNVVVEGTPKAFLPVALVCQARDAGFEIVM